MSGTETVTGILTEIPRGKFRCPICNNLVFRVSERSRGVRFDMDGEILFAHQSCVEKHQSPKSLEKQKKANQNGVSDKKILEVRERIRLKQWGSPEAIADFERRLAELRCKKSKN